MRASCHDDVSRAPRRRGADDECHDRARNLSAEPVSGHRTPRFWTCSRNASLAEATASHCARGTSATHGDATTWATYGRAIAETAAGLHSLGIGFGDRVAILSWNRPEWQEADLGILSTGAISVPVYPTSASPQVGYLLAHSASKVCFVEDSEQLGRVLEQRDRLPDLEHIVVFDDQRRAQRPAARSRSRSSEHGRAGARARSRACRAQPAIR